MEEIKKYSWLANLILKANLSTKRQLLKSFLVAKKKYMPKGNVEADVDNVLKCALCPNMCRFDCPVLNAEKSEALAPSGKMRIAYLLETGKLDFSEDALNLMYRDADCGACKQWCPFSFSVGELSVGVKEDISKENLTPKSLVQFRERVGKRHTIYSEGITSLGIDRNREKANVLYFAGCTALNRRKEVAYATVEILKRASVDFTTLQEEWCCGYPLYVLGFHNYFENFVEHNLKSIEETACKIMVCSCPSCAYLFKELYPKGKLEVEHSSQFFWKLVKEGKISFKELNKEYVFHDPCALSRKLEVHEEPREILRAIPKLNLRESYFNRKNTQCCGKGGALGIADPKLSLEIAKNRISQLKETSRSIVTACPSCELAFKEADKEITVLDISEIILEAIRNER